MLVHEPQPFYFTRKDCMTPGEKWQINVALSKQLLARKEQQIKLETQQRGDVNH